MIYYVDYQDFVVLSNHKTYLEQLPQRIESFKINFDLVLPRDIGKYSEPALGHVTDRAKSVSDLWPGNVKALRSLHLDLATFLAEVQLFANQLYAYESRHADKTREQKVSNLPIHSAPFALQGKLGIAQQSTSEDLLNQIRHRHLLFESEFASLASRSEAIRMNVYGIMPRFIDFMNVKIIGHALKYKNTEPTGPFSLEDQLTTARSRVHWSQNQYLYAMQSSSNMGTYCLHMQTMLSHSNRELRDIGPNTTVHKFVRGVRLMNAHLHVLKKLSDSVRTLLQYRF